MGRFADWVVGRVRNLPPAVDPDSIPPQSELNEDSEDNKLLARAVYTEMAKTADLARQANVEAMRWVMTSLLAVNAGGAVAMTQLEITPGYRVAAGLSFVVGLTLPLFGAHIAANSGWKLISKLGGQLGYWYSVMHDGIRVRETELAVNEINQEAANAQVWPRRLGFLSTSLFALGVACSAYGVWISEIKGL